MNIDHLAISYDNKLFIPVDILADGNCLFRSLVESNINPSNVSKRFRSNLSNRAKILLNNGLLYGRQIRNYFNIKDKFSKGRIIEDYINCVMSVNSK